VGADSRRKETVSSPVPSSANAAAGSLRPSTLAAVSFACIAVTPVATLAALSHAFCDQDHKEERNRYSGNTDNFLSK